MTIVLTNDDGIRSVGLLITKKVLSEMDDVLTIAPKNDRSGIGKVLTLRNLIKVEKKRLADGSMAYALLGTPADAFFIVTKLIRRRPKLLVAGMNLGANLGIEDILTSVILAQSLRLPYMECHRSLYPFVSIKNRGGKSLKLA